VDFKNTVLIMTSNIGAQMIIGGDGMGFRTAKKVDEDARAYESMKNRVTDEMKKVFRPEFLNRVEEVIVFHSLTSQQILAIVDLMLNRVREQLKSQGMSLEASDDVKEVLAKEGFDPAFGARPLRRAVQRVIEDPLSEEILLGRFSEGDTILAELDNGKVIFRKSEKGEPAAVKE
jgi:ATP-dependent Clp protease ATP-binding subunit ClpC